MSCIQPGAGGAWGFSGWGACASSHRGVGRLRALAAGRGCRWKGWSRELASPKGVSTRCPCACRLPPLTPTPAARLLSALPPAACLLTPLPRTPPALRENSCLLVAHCSPSHSAAHSQGPPLASPLASSSLPTCCSAPHLPKLAAKPYTTYKAMHFRYVVAHIKVTIYSNMINPPKFH